MKIKVAIEFEVDVDYSDEKDVMYHEDEIEALVEMMAADAVKGGCGIRYTGDWAYLTEEDKEFESGIIEEYYVVGD